ncbi:hypothetical protein KKD37_01965 [Patescibacteria group bacterium]|nr:hypothetical protein [Patescibacteria group bacterium]
MKIFSKQKIIIILIFLFALILRLSNINWDSDNHLHPDERFLTMVTNDISLPSSLIQYFDSATSPLNPYNYPQYQFFVYGTFPLFLTKILAVFLNLNNYNQIAILGRALSALFDSGNIVLLYLISKKILKSFYIYLPSLFYSVLILPLQLSHFFAVDTFLSFFLLLTFAFFSYQLFIPAFIFFGLALACKISALYFVPVILLFLVKKPKKIIYFVFTFIAFRIFQPYVFSSLFAPNSLFIANIKTLTSFSDPNAFYPPGVQWLNRIPLLNSFKNLTIWGLGLPLSFSLIFFLFRFLLKSKIEFRLNLPFIISFWTLFLFIYQGSQHVHTMRYFLPIYSSICLVFTLLLSHLKINKTIIFFIFFLSSIYAFSFLSIYSRPNSRVQASYWIKNNIPQNSVLSSEYWDDALPLGYSSFQSISLPLFDPDTPQKWAQINYSLDQIDFLVLSSNRLWATIPRVPDKYPIASKFYNNLFSQNTNFVKLTEFNSYPGFSIPQIKSCYYFGPSNFPGVKNSWFSVDKDCYYPGLYLRDDTAEEAFTVYDHPKVLIFSKQK